MTPKEELLSDLRSAASKLGPERCQSALAAFDNPYENQRNSRSCVLARAYGKEGELIKAHGLYDCLAKTSKIMLDIFGLEQDEWSAITRVFDQKCDTQGVTLDDLFGILAAEACKINTPASTKVYAEISQG